MEKNTRWFLETVTSLPADFETIFKEFDANALKIIRLSFFKPDFIIFFFKMLTYYTLYLGGNAIKKAIKDYGFIQTHDEAIAYSGMKVNVF